MKSRRPVWPYLAIAVSMTVTTSCQKPYHQETERYVFIASNVTLPYWQEAKAGFTDASRALGVKIDFIGPDSYSPEEELADFQQAAAKRPAGILVSPARADLFKPAIDAAMKSGIPVICVDSDAPESRRILFIGTDNLRAGLTAGSRMAEVLHGKGLVVLITVPGQLNLDERLSGVKTALKEYPGIKLDRILDDKGDPRSANDQISALIEAKQKIDGILCLEASGGPGAAEALHRLNMSEKIPIVAMDKSPETLDWIKRGGISATIAQKPYTMSFYGLKFLDDLHHNIVHEFRDWRVAPVSPLPTRVDTGTAIVDARNVEAFLAAAVTRREAL